MNQSQQVSIPQSEFFSFTHCPRASTRVLLPGFNSSVGILLVHAAARLLKQLGSLKVSIPQSEFFSFTLVVPVHVATLHRMFQFLSRNSSRSRAIRIM